MELLPIKRAILSVTDKSGLDEFAAFLARNGVEIVSTGGTASFLQKAGVKVLEVSDITGFPEILDGRVKTLHPFIHAGILADKDKPEHLRSLERLGVAPFDLVCVNLYNFARAAENNLPAGEAVEEIDIGGPCMMRAAAKNYHSVLVANSPALYPRIMKVLAAGAMKAPLDLRRECAAGVFAATSAYDAAIAAYLAANGGGRTK
ncbi:MAG: IMP cyclohydrolase [Desulfovibrio sp.]|jgi:phosphoribosylaminoimidazolecarboxamide formyltransferase/IMP cyclohydrolase|nr:IMP cyclohydrolase [Desulfovibrio sp.]